jgi:hypothetical protein
MILARAKNVVKIGISDLNFKFLAGKVFHIFLFFSLFDFLKDFFLKDYKAFDFFKRL